MIVRNQQNVYIFKSLTGGQNETAFISHCSNSQPIYSTRWPRVLFGKGKKEKLAGGVNAYVSLWFVLVANKCKRMVENNGEQKNGK